MAAQPPRTPRHVARGIVRLALFDASGFADFGDTAADFLNSLAPLLAFSLVALGLRTLAGQGLVALDDFLMTVVAVLTPPALTFELAKRWRRTALWCRYATAFTWCSWVVLFVLMLGLMLGMMLHETGASVDVASTVAMVLVVAYEVPFHWFLARRGLDISRWRAVVLVLLVEFITYFVVFILVPFLISATSLEF